VTVWVRRTEIVDPQALADQDVAAIEKRAFERGIDWSPAQATLVWTTESTAEVGRFRKRTRIVRTTGALTDDVLAWTISDDGAPPSAVVVRRSRVDVADGQIAVAGLAPDLLARAGLDADAGSDGVTVRGDLGGRDLGSVFLPLGTGPAADHVRGALLR
jgi:hypothetical protein